MDATNTIFIYKHREHHRSLHKVIKGGKKQDERKSVDGQRNTGEDKKEGRKKTSKEENVQLLQLL